MNFSHLNHFFSSTDTKNSVGLVGLIEEISHNAIAVYWNPLESSAKVSATSNQQINYNPRWDTKKTFTPIFHEKIQFSNEIFDKFAFNVHASPRKELQIDFNLLLKNVW
jgi:hypothetical protein